MRLLNGSPAFFGLCLVLTPGLLLRGASGQGDAIVFGGGATTRKATSNSGIVLLGTLNGICSMFCDRRYCLDNFFAQAYNRR
jgi:hypothetical protein